MKSKSILILIALSACILITGCSMTNGFIGHSIQTDVQLNHANFTVLKTVTGSASATYILGIGPSDQDLMNQARQNMINKADLMGKSRAIINVTTDLETDFFYVIWIRKTAYVSGEVVEFQK